MIDHVLQTGDEIVAFEQQPCRVEAQPILVDLDPEAEHERFELAAVRAIRA